MKTGQILSPAVPASFRTLTSKYTGANIVHSSRIDCNTMDESAEAQAPASAPASAPAPAQSAAAPVHAQHAADHPVENGDGDGTSGRADMQGNGGTSAQSNKRQRRNKPSLSCEACTTKKTKVKQSKLPACCKS